MKNFNQALLDLILDKEMPRLNMIMEEVSKDIQKDLIKKTKDVIDKYYQDFDPEFYIRVDDYRATPSKRRNKNGNRLIRKKDRNVSLRTAITRGLDNGAVGICRPLENMWGYQAGIQFDELYFNQHMKHSYKGDNFTEWDIVEDFLWGVHGNVDVATTDPSAGLELYEFINTYKPKFDQHYNNALNKIK